MASSIASEKIDFENNSDSERVDCSLSKKDLAQYQDFLMIGKLTPEVVHDINNYLTGILGYAELLSLKKPSDDSLKNGLKNIYISAEKCKDLLANLIALARPDSTLVRLGNLNEIVEKSILLRGCALRHRQIVVSTDLGKDIPFIPIQGNKLEKILMELIFQLEASLEGQGKNRRIAFKTFFQAPDDVVLRLEVSASENAYEDLRRYFTPEEKELKRGDCLRLGLREFSGWIDELGLSLEIEKTGEEGFALEIHLPLKN